MVGVDSNTHSLVVSASCVPSVPSSVTVSLSVTDAAGMLEVTIHDLAASTEKSNHGLDVRLVEHGVHAAGIRHFELGVQVDVAVGRVDAAVQAFTGVGILAQRLDGHFVVRFEVLQFDTAVGERFGRIESCAVEYDFAHFSGDQVKEAGSSRLSIERDGGFGTEILGSTGQIKFDRVMNRCCDNAFAFFRFRFG